MFTIEEMQFGGMLTMTLLALMLVVCVPRRSVLHAGFGLGRWMMAAGTMTIAVQFMLQHIFGFRAMGVTQAVLWNLLLFLPAAMFINMALLYVQRRGIVRRQEWLFGGVVCTINTLILTVTLLADGVPLESDSVALERAEIVGAVLFMAMQGYYFRLHYIEYHRLQKAVDEYFDRKRDDLLGWMARSMFLLAVLATLVPVAIFFQGVPLVIFSVLLFISIAYCVVSFYSYGISEDLTRVEESSLTPDPSPKGEGNSIDEQNCLDTLDTDVSQHITEAVEQWKQSGAYREHNLTLAIVARQLHVPGRQLQLWLRQSEYGKLATLVTSLRIDEAKRVLREHPDWTIDSVADHCGFNGRKYFHQVFMEQTGTTPAKYQQER